MGIEEEITREANRLIARHETKGRLIAEENVRRARRSTVQPDKIKHTQPVYWDYNDGFNPYLTRARTSRIAHSIQKRFKDRTYQPRSPIGHEVPKADGSTRTVCIYQVADGAMSKMLFEGILKKNLPVLSSRAYAYRKDVSAQNAIQYVRSEFKNRNRLFVAEYHFSKFFDTIDHDHIRRVLKDQFLLTEIEKYAIEGFLRVAPSIGSPYNPNVDKIRERGVPQGTSISLFLANVAAWELDRSLERVGVGFVRYADDTLIWSTDYGRICEAVDLLYEQAETIGVSINISKSPGLRILVPSDAESEMESTEYVDYLGYRLGLDATTLREPSIKKIKKRIGQLIYWGLICEPLNKTQHLDRLGGNVDRDYVSVIWRIRRYLYGDLSEKAVKRYQRRDAPLRRFKGVMSAYPLIDDTDDLKQLDEWIIDQLYLSMRKRSTLLVLQGIGPHLPTPHGMSRSDLKRLKVTATNTNQEIDLTIPSVRRIANIIRQAAAKHGPSVVGRADPYRY